MRTFHWSRPAQQLVGQCPPTLAGLWSAVYTTEHVALALAVSSSVLPTADFTGVGMDLADAVEALEMARPDLVGGPTVKLGLTSPIIDFAGPTGELAALIRDCIRLAADLLGNPDQPLSAAEVLAVSRCAALLSDAHVRATGRLP